MSLRADPIYRAMPAKKNPASNIETSDGSEETSEGRRERNFEIQVMDSRGRISSIYEESTLDIDIASDLTRITNPKYLKYLEFLMENRRRDARQCS